MTPDHRPFRSRPGRQDGFTLIELLVVIVILGVIAAIVVFSVRGVGDKGRKNAVAADAATLRTAQESYCARHGHYGTVDDLKTDGLLAGDPVYNAMMVGEENKCGRGEKSSYTLYDASPSERGAEPIKVGEGPTDLAVDEKADRVYVVSKIANSVTVIDGKTDEPIGAPIDVSGAVSNPTRIAVDPASGRVYVGGTGSVAIIDTANGNQVTRVAFPATVGALAVSPDNGDVYIGGETTTLSYIAAGSSSATPIPLPTEARLVSASNGMDFSFHAARHELYFAKQGVGAGASPHIGLFAISTQTHTVRLVTEFPTKSGCSVGGYGHLMPQSARGVTAVDPNRGLVYLLARRCVHDPAKNALVQVGTAIAIDPGSGASTPIDDPATVNATPLIAVYNAAAGSVYLFSSMQGKPDGTCGSVEGRVSRIVGTSAMGEASVCGLSVQSAGNTAHKVAMLKNFNRVFIAQRRVEATEVTRPSPGGLGVVDGSTMLTQGLLGTPSEYASLAVNNTTGKVYALDPANKTVAVFRTGSV
ncbi:prepilin-type N-terminal cleavage/methylation domain-containing protein [Streptomyces sp. NPDC048606]|uniref:prepilin-type N-terminal cleavage/methylation domain-containing protein n=1 Tax=Streptomyces sp. NPDC048606 TaxID=3154726 RepID=UPI003423DBB5